MISRPKVQTRADRAIGYTNLVLASLELGRIIGMPTML